MDNGTCPNGHSRTEELCKKIRALAHIIIKKPQENNNNTSAGTNKSEANCTTNPCLYCSITQEENLLLQPFNKLSFPVLHTSKTITGFIKKLSSPSK